MSLIHFSYELLRFVRRIPTKNILIIRYYDVYGYPQTENIHDSKDNI